MGPYVFAAVYWKCSNRSRENYSLKVQTMRLLIKSRRLATLRKIAMPQRHAKVVPRVSRFYSFARETKSAPRWAYLPHLVKGPHSCHCFTGVLEGVSEIRHCGANVSHCHRCGFSPLQNLVISKPLLCTKRGPCVRRMFEMSRGCCPCHDSCPARQSGRSCTSLKWAWPVGTRVNALFSQSSSV